MTTLVERPVEPPQYFPINKDEAREILKFFEGEYLNPNNHPALNELLNKLAHFVRS